MNYPGVGGTSNKLAKENEIFDLLLKCIGGDEYHNKFACFSKQKRGLLIFCRNRGHDDVKQVNISDGVRIRAIFKAISHKMVDLTACCVEIHVTVLKMIYDMVWQMDPSKYYLRRIYLSI